MVDEFAGPRKLRYFVYLMVFLVFAAVFSTTLAELYGITFFEPIVWGAVENPMAMFELAGVLSIIALLIIASMKALKMADNSGF